MIKVKSKETYENERRDVNSMVYQVQVTEKAREVCNKSSYHIIEVKINLMETELIC